MFAVAHVPVVSHPKSKPAMFTPVCVSEPVAAAAADVVVGVVEVLEVADDVAVVALAVVVAVPGRLIAQKMSALLVRHFLQKSNSIPLRVVWVRICAHAGGASRCSGPTNSTTFLRRMPSDPIGLSSDEMKHVHCP